MKFLRYFYNDSEHLGIEKNGKIFELNAFPLSKSFEDMNDFITNHTKEDMMVLSNNALDNFVTPDEVKFLSPFERTLHDVICVGLNYAKHIAEAHANLSTEDTINATYFSKRAEVISYHESDIILDSEVDSSMDYETELGIILGKRGKNIPEDEALDYVFGYTIINDYSARALQKAHNQWYKGKSLDGYTAIGPYIITKDEFEHPLKLKLTTKVNDELRQDSNTEFMIRGVENLINDISQGLTLVPGDIIATGTPEGVGMGFTPGKFLKAGDKVESYIEGIGSLVNYIK